MAELNDKLITYGNLSTFYDKLQEQGLGGNTIEDASVLPDAGENKSKLIRLKSDDNVYVSELKSRTSTTTNRLPDEQQIDKAYLYDTGDFTLSYYKGAYHIICNDGETDGYMWYQEGFVIISLDNAASISTNGNISYYYEIGEQATIDENTRTITIDDILSMLSDVTLDEQIKLIPAIYNAPESAQIGNAELDEVQNAITFIYDGSTATITIDGEQITGYKWLSEDAPGGYLLTNKQASNIYYYYDEDNDVIYSDVKCYLYVDGAATETSFNYPLIPQLNAPDSEQVGNATRILTATSGLFYRGDTLYTLIDDYNHSYTGYKWSNDDETNFQFTLKKASEIYGDIDTYVVDNYVYFWEYLGNNTYHRTDEEPFGVPYEVEIRNFNIVKYQRTEVTEEWDWEKVATEQYVDDAIDNIDVPEYVAGEGIDIDSSSMTISCTVKPIADVSVLPDAFENKDNIYRLENNKDLYVAKYSNLLNAPDSEQVDNAYLEVYRQYQFIYKGEITAYFTDGILQLFRWYDATQPYNIYTINSANSIYSLPTTGCQSEEAIELYYDSEEDIYKSTKLSVADAQEAFNQHYSIDLSDISIVKGNYQWQRVVTEDTINIQNESTFTGATLTVDGSQPSIVASGSTTIIWDDLASSIPSGKTLEVSVVLINTGNSALTPTMSGNYQMMGDGNITIQPLELGLYKAKYISSVDVWLVEAINQEVSGTVE